MRRFIALALLICIGSMAVACSDADRGKILSYGSSAKVVCYSGGIVIYNGFSTGKVKSEENSDGYYFVDKENGDQLEISGNCVITYK